MKHNMFCSTCGCKCLVSKVSFSTLRFDDVFSSEKEIVHVDLITVLIL